MCNANIFRPLYADEIEVRVQQVAERNGKARAMLLLYKNARVDMDMLDEKFGCLGWQREHTFKNNKNYCKVSVYDADKQMWISKEDVGVESNTEETKGEASDSFKRACVNLGIGRELYSAPTIAIDLNDKEWHTNQKSGKPAINNWIKYRVHAITYNAERKIIGLTIVDGNNNIRFTMGEATRPTQPTAQRERKTLSMDDIMDEKVLNNICGWLNRNAKGRKIEDVLNSNYICDNETIRCITNEYLRTYGNNPS